MPKPRNSRLESASSRAKLEPRRKPYWLKVSPNIFLGYRKNVGPGSWSVRCTENGADWIKKLGIADDLERADGRAVLSFWQAQEAARKLARRLPGDPTDDATRPLTTAEALTRYEADLRARGGDPYNAKWPRIHLPASILNKPVSMLTANELRRWRDAAISNGVAPDTFNRIKKSICAALNLAAEHDPRGITNRHAWQVGLRAMPDAGEANNVILDDPTVRVLVAEAYKRDHALGLLVDVAAVTGARPSQIARLTVADLDLADASKPRLQMPKSGKGGTNKRAERKRERIPVPITPALAALLKQESKGRAPDAPLLLRSNGDPWGYRRSNQYRHDIREVVKAIGRDPDEVTIYALRHSAIVRHLLANTPIRVAAALVDSSVAMLERHYSRFIARHSDEIARKALLHPEPTDNVVALKR